MNGKTKNLLYGKLLSGFPGLAEAGKDKYIKLCEPENPKFFGSIARAAIHSGAKKIMEGGL